MVVNDRILNRDPGWNVGTAMVVNDRILNRDPGWNVETVRALSSLPDLFARGRPARLVRVSDDGVVELTAPALVLTMSRAASYEAARGGEWIPVAPPGPLAKSIVEVGHYPGVRPLTGVTRVPQLRPDGRVVCEPGYDAESGLWYAGPRIDLEGRPDKDAARTSLEKLLEPMAKFPFANDAARSAWLALVLTLVMRGLIDGCVPMFVGSANQARTGKTLSVQLATLIATGELARARLPPHHEEEWDKTIAAILLSEQPDVALIDNVPAGSAIGCATLDAALTSRSVGCRVLGSSVVRVVDDVRTVFAVTTNGASYRADTALRTVPIRLHCSDTHPEARVFEGDVRARVRGQQLELLRHALTVGRAWLLAGAPTQSLTSWGSFEAWSGVVRQVLVWAGKADPLVAREGIEQDDVGRTDHDRLVALCWDLFGEGDWISADLAKRVEALDEKSAPLSRDFRIDGNSLDGWTAGQAQDLLAELGAWDRAARRVDRRALGYLIREALERPASVGDKDPVPKRIKRTGERHPRLRVPMLRCE